MPGVASRPAALSSVRAPPVDIRPLARRLARGDFDGITIAVQALHQAEDPSEAKRLANDVFIRHRFDGGMLLRADEPDAGTRGVVLREPLPPLSLCSHVERDQSRPG